MSLSTFSKALIVGCVLAGEALAAQSSNELHIFGSTDPSGVRRDWVVSETKFCSTKPWSPENQAPPLATSAAVQAAIKARPAKKRWIITEVSIQAAGCGQEFRWYYKIAMYDEAGTTADYPPETVDQVVLMDGSLVVPKLGKR